MKTEQAICDFQNRLESLGVANNAVFWRGVLLALQWVCEQSTLIEDDVDHIISRLAFFHAQSQVGKDTCTACTDEMPCWIHRGAPEDLLKQLV